MTFLVVLSFGDLPRKICQARIVGRVKSMNDQISARLIVEALHLRLKFSAQRGNQ